MALPKAITDLSESFSRLPGVGPKLSSKIALYLSISNKKLASKLSGDISNVLSGIKECENCFNVTEESICEICDSDEREDKVIMVVENSLDLYTIEETSEYNGLYHVLNGIISPVNGIGPDDINIKELIERIKKGEINELIFGLNPNLEGESTMLYIKNELEELGLSEKMTFTRLAKGIPTGSSIEFMSTQTISDSLKRRDSF